MITIDHSLLSAFLLGLLGSSHCVGMCGGISAAMALNFNGSFLAISSRLFAFNCGRVFCYALLGVVVGFSSWILAEHFQGIVIWLRVFAGLMLIAMACYVAQWWMGLTVLEQAGQKIWHYLTPTVQRFLPMQTISHALIAGCLWGLLPCGLIYSVLVWASLAGDWQQSGLTMVFFGLGTLPAMITTGLGSSGLKSVLQKKHFRQTVAVMLFGFGVWTILMATGTKSM